MKQRHITRTTLMTATLALAACGGGGSGGGNDATPAQSALFFGSTDPNAAANGLDYAEDGSSGPDLLGQDINVRLVTTDLETDDPDDVVIVGDGILRVGESGSFTLTVDGETISFSDEEPETNGPVNVAQVSFGDFSGAAIGFSGEITDDEETFNSAQFASFGFETNPEQIAALTGAVSYNTQLLAFVTRNDQAGSDPIIAAAQLEIVANFDDSAITGDGVLFVDDDDLDTSFLLVALDETTIQGNGFATDLTAVGCGTALDCSSSSEIGGVFYGPNAEELGGVATLDVSITNLDGETVQYVGGGALSTGNIIDFE